MAFLPAQLQSFTLSGSGVSIASTTLTLSSFTTIDGVALAMSDFGTIGYMTIEPGSRDREEQISFTGVSQNANGTATLTGIKTVLFLSPYTETSGFTKSHPGGVVAVVSNTSGFYNRFAIKNNTETITGYWAVPDPVSSTDIANKQWVLSVVNGGTVSQNSVIVAGTAGETVSAGNIVYLKAADGRWWLATSASAATTDLLILGIAQGSGTAGNTITGGVLVKGLDANQSGLTGGVIYYLSTAGTISSSAGATARAIGQGATATTLYFDPYFFYTPTALQKAALAGNNGTPSSTNTYVTVDGLSAVSTNIQTFTTIGANTWNKPTGAKAVNVVLIGGGGGGCGAAAGSTGGGGGGGEVCQRTYEAGLLSSSVTVTIGAGGTGGSSTSGAVGSNTSFGAYLIATGGGGGQTTTTGGGYSGFIGPNQDVTQVSLQSLFGTGAVGNASARTGSDGSAYWAGGGGNKYSNNGTPSAGGTQRNGTPTTNSPIGGTGGDGDSGNNTGGTNGGFYGGGGGGGTTTGHDGAKGIAVITTYF